MVIGKINAPAYQQVFIQIDMGKFIAALANFIPQVVADFRSGFRERTHQRYGNQLEKQ